MKTGFWLKGGKGKLAGATVYQQNGETVMREVVSPTNPKTEKQIIQRIINRQNEPRPWNSEGLPFLIMDLIGARDINGEEVKPKSLL